MTKSSPFVLKDETQRNHPADDVIGKRAEAAWLFPNSTRPALDVFGWRRVEVETRMDDLAAWAQRWRA